MQIKSSGSRVNIIVAQGNDYYKIVRQIKAKVSETKHMKESILWLCNIYNIYSPFNFL